MSGIVDKIIPLLNVDETRHLAMRALSTITHHGGSQIRTEIAKHGNSIAKLITDLPDDEKLTDLGIAVLAHSISAAVEGDEKPTHAKALKSIDMVDILRSTLEAVKRPHSRPRTYDRPRHRAGGHVEHACRERVQGVPVGDWLLGRRDAEQGLGDALFVPRWSHKAIPPRSGGRPAQPRSQPVHGGGPARRAVEPQQHLHGLRAVPLRNVSDALLHERVPGRDVGMHPDV